MKRMMISQTNKQNDCCELERVEPCLKNTFLVSLTVQANIASSRHFQGKKTDMKKIYLDKVFKHSGYLIALFQVES